MAIIPGESPVQRESSLAIHAGPGEQRWDDQIAPPFRVHHRSVGNTPTTAGSKGIGNTRAPELRELTTGERQQIASGAVRCGEGANATR